MKVINSNYGVSKALVDHLGETFPDRLPKDFVNPQQLAFLQGQQSVIFYLVQMYEEMLEEN
jgi:hypothetical protein